MSEQERAQKEHAQNLRNFAVAFGRGQARALDRFGNDIRDGDQLMVRFQVDPVVSVVSVNPVLDPKVPAGLIDVMCTVTFPLRVPAGQMYQGCNIVARRAETSVPQGSDNGKGPGPMLADRSDAPAAPDTQEPDEAIDPDKPVIV